jgi:hypothetical protein
MSSEKPFKPHIDIWSTRWQTPDEFFQGATGEAIEHIKKYKGRVKLRFAVRYETEKDREAAAKEGQSS